MYRLQGGYPALCARQGPGTNSALTDGTYVSPCILQPSFRSRRAGVCNGRIYPHDTEKTIDFLQNYMPNIDCRFHFKEVTFVDVTNLLNDLPSDKASGLDHISTKLLKHSAPVVSRSLAHIFSKSLRNGRFHTELKQARDAAIFKKGNKSNPGNNSPISILPV